jgi:hypothetical protein
VVDLAVEERGLLRRVVHDMGAAAELDGRVEARRGAVLGRDVLGGLPGAGHVHVVADHAQHDLRIGLQRGPERVRAGEMGDDDAALVVVGEVQGLDVGRLARQAVDGELAEVVIGQPPLPFGVVAGRVPGVDQHHRASR